MPQDKLNPDRCLFEFRRMQWIATLLLAAMTAIFIACVATKRDRPWLPYVRAFAEAGMVGACADWFAVTALFRHPLGVPIPHTAVVPRNKQRIGGALGRFITNNFLSPKVADQRLAQIDIVAFAARWIDSSENSVRLSRWISWLLSRAAKQAGG